MLPEPLTRAIALRDPLDALAALAGLPHRFLLHTALDDPRSRWSFFGADPVAVVRGGGRAELRAALGASAAPRGGDPDLPPFRGGVVGYWSYDYGRRLERLPAIARDDVGLPDLVAGVYDVVGAWDRRTGRAWLFANGAPDRGDAARDRARSRLEFFAQRLARGTTARPAPAPSGASVSAVSTFGAEPYRRGVERIQDHIRRGDLFQANLSQRWTIARPGDGLAVAPALFEAACRRTPAPFAAFFDAGDHAIVSASPERFLEKRGTRVETRPIKGTRPRGFCPAEDEQLAAELLASAKDRAENVMIVDVLRNDLGRVCVTGSVATTALCELERFPQVFHLTSTVTGRLRDDVDAFGLLDAAFPGGSITGAPKIRAMEILETLEPVRRHVYTGAIGYVGWDGDADWSIAIRTALATPDAIRFAAGGGITADSDPEAEHLETLDKAEGLRLALAEVLGPVTLADRAAAR